MRLINTSTLELHEFSGHPIPAYAILSHTWSSGEISFYDMQRPRRQSTAWEKISSCSKQASVDGLEYIWVDTCCIDKSSSADLSEAINSMYKWYKNATICYAYLADVASPEGQAIISHSPCNVLEPTVLSEFITDEFYEARQKIIGSAFAYSRWWTRGWTLQELIAPPQVAFFSKDWVFIGKRLEEELGSKIADITGISRDVIAGADPGIKSIAQRMSWASRRITTRVEDVAYCLLGIFNINMPILYGEGKRAFIRLQEEIMKKSDDHSLFAWKQVTDSGEKYRGLLAQSPAEFEDSFDVVPFRNWKVSNPYAITNMGIHIQLGLTESLPNYHHRGLQFTSLAVLNCYRTSKETVGPVCIYLEEMFKYGDQFCRKFPHEAPVVSYMNFDSVKYTYIYVRQEVTTPDAAETRVMFKILLQTDVLGILDYKLVEVWPSLKWNEEEKTLTVGPYSEGCFAGAMLFVSDRDNSHFVVSLKFNNVSGMLCNIVNSPLDEAYNGAVAAYLDSRMDDSGYSNNPSRFPDQVSIKDTPVLATIEEKLCFRPRIWVLSFSER
jgi:hypothetical protein